MTTLDDLDKEFETRDEAFHEIIRLRAQLETAHKDATEKAAKISNSLCDAQWRAMIKPEPGKDKLTPGETQIGDMISKAIRRGSLY